MHNRHDARRRISHESPLPRPRAKWENHSLLAAMPDAIRCVYSTTRQGSMTRRQAKAEGAKYYNEGRCLCPRGHSPILRRTLDGACLACERLKNAASYASASGRDMHKAASRRWKEHNADRMAAYVIDAAPQRKARMALYRRANRAELVAKKRLWRKANPDKDRAMADRYREANKDQLRQRFANWSAKKGKLFFRVKQGVRRTRQLNNGGSHTATDIEHIAKSQLQKCAYCRADLGRRFHVDHILPVALGGSSDRRNLQLLCVRCNSSKGAKHPLAFARTLGLLL